MQKTSFSFGVLAILGTLIIIILALLAGTYNRLIAKTQNIDAAWAQVETQYQRRLDLIPNLVESTKGFLTQEQTVFSQIAQARTKYSGATTTSDKAAALGELDSALSRLLVIVENYPQLKSNETVARLMDELAGTENRIAVARKDYNEKVRDYNTTIKTIPTNLIAGFFGFTQKNYFEAAQGAEQAPKVDLKLTP